MKTKGKAIWKFQYKGAFDCKIEMPKGAEILSAQLQNDIICIWALVDPSAEKETRNFSLVGTGHHIKTDDGKFIATFVFPKIFNFFNQVYHLFEF